MKSLLHSVIKIENISKPISRLALGTAFYREAEKKVWFGILDKFLEAGGTVIDTARGYGNGLSERVIGEWMALRDSRESTILVTKCGVTDNKLPEDGFDEMVTVELGESQETLKTSYIDLYILHRDNPVIPVSPIMERLNREIERGTVRAIGASNWSYNRVEEANTYAREHGLKGFAVVSNNLSLARPLEAFYPGLVSTDREGEKWHRRTGTPLLSWSSQARGFFTPRYTPDILPTAANRKSKGVSDPFERRMIEVYASEENFERKQRAEELGRERNCSPVEIALAWLLNNPFPVIPIIGPHSGTELESCLKAVTIGLTVKERRWLDLLEARQSRSAPKQKG